MVYYIKNSIKFNTLSILLTLRLSILCSLLMSFPTQLFSAQEQASSDFSISAIGAFLPFVLLLLAAFFVILLTLRLKRERNRSSILRQDLSLMEKTMDVVPLDIIWLDSDQRVIKVNQAASVITGIPKDQFIGNLLNDTLQEDLPRGYLKRQVSGSEESEIEEKFLVHKSVSYLDLAGEKIGVRYGDSLAECRRLNKKILRCEEKIQETNDAVVRARRMKSEFLANMNHEIRTPMNAIIGYAEMLANAELGSREKRFVETIHRSGTSLISMLNDIMDLSKIEAGRMKIVRSAIRLQGIVDEVTDLFQEQIREKRLQFNNTVDSNLPFFFILDGIRLKQVLINLVSNAVKFSDQGIISLTVYGTKSVGTNNRYDLVFCVEDTGLGISGDELEALMQLFGQYGDDSAKEYSGEGLGLALCGRLVSMMGGKITLESTLGKGSRFTVILNQVEVSADELFDPLPVKPFSRQRARKLMVVDDVDLILEVFNDYFSDSKIEVLSASQGEDALILAAKEKPQIIFMDLNLIGMDGRTVTEKLRQDPATADIPVIVMTGKILEEEEYKPLFDDFLQKPFGINTLQQLIDKYIIMEPEEAVPSTQWSTGDVEGYEDFADDLRSFWNYELEKLLLQVTSSGSLSAATALGEGLIETGEISQQDHILKMGKQLVQYASEPDIIGMDQVISQLTRITDRKDV